MPPKAKSLSEAEVQQLREAVNYTKVARDLGISQRRARAIKQAATLDEARALGRVGGVGAAPKPAAVVFSLGQMQVEVDAQDFYEAYILYCDLKARGIIVQDGFGAVIKDSLMLAWRLLVEGSGPRSGPRQARWEARRQHGQA